MYDKKVNEYKEEQGRILDQMQAHSDADYDFYLTSPNGQRKFSIVLK